MVKVHNYITSVLITHKNFKKDKVASQWIIKQKKATCVLNDPNHYVNTLMEYTTFIMAGKILFFR